MKNAAKDKGSVEINVSDSDSNSETSNFGSRRKKILLNNEQIFTKLQNNPAARANLASIHAARSHKYGHVQFGPKSWYREVVNISKKLTSQQDRRKFRQGLKCNIDFLNQLNMDDLMSNLLQGECGLNDLPKAVKIKFGEIFKCVRETPVIDIFKLINDAKANKIFSSIEEIVSLAHVS